MGTKKIGDLFNQIDRVNELRETIQSKKFTLDWH